METWKDIGGYEGLYQVSTLGRIRSLGRKCATKANGTQTKKKRILTQEITSYGYCRVRLYNNCGDAKHYHVHRLVVETFIRPLQDKEQVNHINEIKTDNRIENLEICTAKYNCNYGSRNETLRTKNTGRKVTENTKERLSAHFSIPVSQYDVSGNYIATYSSAKDASVKTGINESNINRCRRGIRNSAGGYLWR